MNLETARSQMLGQQVRAWDVLDQRVLDVLGSTPRERFVPDDFRELAFADMEIPLGHGQYMMAPKVEGRVLQALDVVSADDVLEIGAGSGYLTACLARLGARVTSVDIYPEFVETAERKLSEHRIGNVELSAADALTLSYSSQFDVIAVTASVPELTDHFVDMLRPDGRLFIVVGKAPVMEAQLVIRHVNGEISIESLFETELAPMINFEITEPFEL